jgi:signal transduction histidine kinase
MVAYQGDRHSPLTPEVGSRVDLDPDSVTANVLQTGRSARKGADSERAAGVVDQVAVPIVVEGALWGAITILTSEHRFPDDTEQRMAEFTELAATAVANAEGRSELAASRARIVAAGDEMRRRIERDLHDGTQQRLVSLGLALRIAQTSLPDDLDEAHQRIAAIADELDAAIHELRELSRGIHPAVLSEGGLGAALRTLARRSAIPVELEIRTAADLPEPVEVAFYYVVSEALTNATRLARASRVDIAMDAWDGGLRLFIHDDGVGGADANRGTGLIGLRDRVESLGGSIVITSPPGEGTSIVVELPLDRERSDAAWSPGTRASA